MALELHKLPEEIDTIDHDDALRIVLFLQQEHERQEEARNKSGGSTGNKTHTETTRMTKKKPRKPTK